MFLDALPDLTPNVFFRFAKLVRELYIRVGRYTEDGALGFGFFVGATTCAPDFTFPLSRTPDRGNPSQVLSTFDGNDDSIANGEVLGCIGGEKALTVPLEPDFDELGSFSAQ